MAERPGLAGALAACLEHGAAVLLVEERTRLARDEYAAHDALRTFAHAGVKVLYADGSNGNDASDPAAMLLDGIGHAVAAYDRRVIVARMAAGRQSKALAGASLSRSRRQVALRLSTQPLRRRRG
ncbi:MAG: recombinase family protein [Solirubrobacteraceae bacterium]